ncbi:MAG: crossover junction endodeoxyribonuclease RuvC [Cyanobacteriota bacterium]
MIIFGIDPGMAIVGYCALEVNENNKCAIKTWGSIQTDKSKHLSSRLLEIHEDLKILLAQVKPDVISIEELYFFKNAKTLIPVLEAKGVILLTAEMFNVPVYEYTPLVVKQVITGYGRAEKPEVKDMLLKHLQITDGAKLDDVIDAAAIAYCHMRHCE